MSEAKIRQINHKEIKKNKRFFTEKNVYFFHRLQITGTWSFPQQWLQSVTHFMIRTYPCSSFHIAR